MRRLIITNNAFDFLDFHVETFDTVLSGLYEKVNIDDATKLCNEKSSIFSLPQRFSQTKIK